MLRPVLCRRILIVCLALTFSVPPLGCAVARRSVALHIDEHASVQNLIRPFAMGMSEETALAMPQIVEVNMNYCVLTSPSQFSPARKVTLSDGSEMILLFDVDGLTYVNIVATDRDLCGVRIGDTLKQVLNQWPNATVYHNPGGARGGIACVTPFPGISLSLLPTPPTWDGQVHICDEICSEAKVHSIIVEYVHDSDAEDEPYKPF